MNNTSNKTQQSPLHVAQQWIKNGQKVAIARVLSTWGSSPRPAGSILAINNNSDFSGSVSGGCVESTVIKSALDVISSNSPKTVKFGVDNDQAWEAGLACGGQISIRIEPAAPDIITTLVANHTKRVSTAWVTNLKTGQHHLFIEGQDITWQESSEAIIGNKIRNAIKTGKSLVSESKESHLFINAFSSEPKIIIVGAVHIAQYLATLATHAEFDVTIIDPRTSFANNQRFPNSTVINDWPDDALNCMTIDSNTAIVILTHNPELDDAALTATLSSDAFYIGALGSKKTHNKRLNRLYKNGHSTALLDRINGPIGLDLGGKSPAEIAIAILAEIIQKLRKVQ